MHTESSALHNGKHFGDWLVLSFKIHSALFGELKSRRLNGKSWIRRKTSWRSARGDSHPPRSPLGLRQPLILAKRLHGWRKPDREDNPSKLPIRLRVATRRYRSVLGADYPPLPPPRPRPELIPSFPPISHLKATLIVEMCFQYNSFHPPPPPRPLSKCDIFHHQAFGGKWNLGGFLCPSSQPRLSRYSEYFRPQEKYFQIKVKASGKNKRKKKPQKP